MHIISHAKIVQAQAAHPNCSAVLDQWYRLTKRARWGCAEVKACSPAVNKVGDKYLFDVGDNKLRVIARAVLTFLMAQHGLRQPDLPEIGNQIKVPEILPSKHTSNLRHAQAPAGHLRWGSRFLRNKSWASSDRYGRSVRFSVRFFPFCELPPDPSP